MDLTLRIKDVIKYSGLSIRAFAIKCGLTQSTLDRMIRGVNAMNLSCVRAVLQTFPEISAEWLMRGTGLMSTSATAVIETERTNKLVDTIATLQETINEKDRTIRLLQEQVNFLKSQLQ